MLLKNDKARIDVSEAALRDLAEIIAREVCKPETKLTNFNRVVELTYQALDRELKK